MPRPLALLRWRLLLILWLVSQGQAQHTFDVWTADNGLPQNLIRDVSQTPDGYLWIATLDGLARFDGVSFTVFNKANSPGIESTRFSQLYQDRNGDLWLSTEGSGLTRYHHGRFTTFSTQDGLPHNNILGVIGDELGNLWALSGNSIVQWDESTSRFQDVTPHTPPITYELCYWEGGGFWGTDGRRLYRFVKGHLITYLLAEWLRRRPLVAVAVDQSGTLWLETADGLQATMVNGDFKRNPLKTVIYNDHAGNRWSIGVGSRLGRYLIYTAAGRAEKIRFVSFREDHEGNVWLATEGWGLYRARRRFVTVYSKEEGLVDRVVYPVFQDHEGAIWIGAWPSGLSRWLNGKFTHYTSADGLAGNLVSALAEDREGRLWAATHGGVCVFERGRFRKPAGLATPDDAAVQAIHLDREGALWLGSSRGLVRYKEGHSKGLTTKDGLVSDDVRVITEGLAGDLWIGGYGGLTHLADGRFTRWTEHDGLPSNAVRAIYEDRDGIVWIGTYDGGLCRFRNGKFTRYTMREGLFNNGVFRILEDKRGNFWMSCNRGIYRVSKRELNEFAAGARSYITSVSYGRSDGMRNEECNGGSQPAGIAARDGTLWFPTQDGVAVINPEAVPSNSQPPPVEIESFLLDHHPIPLDRPVSLQPAKTNFEIQYTALSFIDSSQIRFRYKLQGLDTDWIDAGGQRAAYYSHVPPGDYVFTVIARNRDGIWNTVGKSLRLTVVTPYYRTWWFASLVALSVGLLIAAAWRYRGSQLERVHALQQAFSRQLIASQESERKRIAVELHDSLGQRLVVIKNLALFFLRAQASQSGLGNGLNQIEEISSEASLAINETREISYNLRPFQLDRLGLTKAVQGMIRTASDACGILFSSDLANVDDAFSEGLRINFYRIVQECLNNIAKHAQATEGSVTIRRAAERVFLVIRDNGCGFVPGVPSDGGLGGFGLIGMSERARLLSGELTIQSTQGRGTTVNVEFHLRSDDRVQPNSHPDRG